MTTSDLRDRLDELAAAVPTPDTSRVDRAWRAAGRRRRRTSIAGATIGVAAVAVGSVAALGNGDGASRPAPAVPPAVTGTTGPAIPSPTTDIPATTPPDGEYDGVPVWWAPDAAGDATLPTYASGLPATVDLAAGRPELGPTDALLAVSAIYDLESGRFERLVALADDGITYSLAAPQVRSNRDAGGNAAALLPSEGGLSRDGRFLAVAQVSSIELYDVRAAIWRTIDVATFAAEGLRWLEDGRLWVPAGGFEPNGRAYTVTGEVSNGVMPPFARRVVADGDQPYGPWVAGPDDVHAGTSYLDGPVTGGDYSNPEGIVVKGDDGTHVLALSAMGRGKGCCPVIGWLDDDLVAFETSGRVLAWRVGSSTLVRVSELTGRASDEAVATSWADDLLG